MDTKMKDGGPAFPHDNLELGDRHLIAQPGMTLRDYFAQSAPFAEIEELQRKHLSRLAQETLVGRAYPSEPRRESKTSSEDIVKYQLECARFFADVGAALRFMHADAMLAARSGDK